MNVWIWFVKLHIVWDTKNRVDLREEKKWDLGRVLIWKERLLLYALVMEWWIENEWCVWENEFSQNSVFVDFWVGEWNWRYGLVLKMKEDGIRNSTMVGSKNRVGTFGHHFQNLTPFSRIGLLLVVWMKIIWWIESLMEIGFVILNKLIRVLCESFWMNLKYGSDWEKLSQV